MRLGIAFILCLALRADAANWYVDNAATGANNGTSWTDAWANPTNVVWASVNPGDTVYVSGGTSSQVYTNRLFPTAGKSGTLGNYISIRVGQDAGHNGVAIFDGVGIGPSSTSQYFWLNGSRSDAFVGPTNYAQVMNGSTAITNNCGFVVRNIPGVTDTIDTDPVLWNFSTSPKNLRFSYIEVSGLSNTLCGVGCDWKGTVCYINGNGTVSSNVVFEYLYLHDNTCQQFSSGSILDSGFDKIVFKFGCILNGGEDHFEVNHGWTIRDSVIGPVKGYGKTHADLFQLTGNNIKIYNNDIRESANSIMRIQTYPDEPSLGMRSNIWFFNNLVTEKQGRASAGGTKTEPFCVVHFDPDHPATNVTLKSIIFANNLFYNSVSNTAGTPTLALNPLIYWTKGNVTNAFISDCKWVNNIVVDKQKGISFPATTNLISTGYVPYTTNDLWVDYNVQAATNASLQTPMNCAYMDATFSNGIGGAFVFHNKTNYPAWQSKEGDNFELKTSDVSSLDSGYDMSAYFDFDALNRPRDVNGAWDRGPLELQTTDTNLLVSITFEDDFADGKLDDHSGCGDDAYRFGRPSSVYPTNFPTKIVASAVTGTNPSTYAGNFVWWTNSDYGFYNKDGQYAAITNVQNFTNLNQMTIAVRARYNSAKRIDSSYDYTADGNATLISAGTASGVVGSWDLQRFNQSIDENNTRFVILTNGSFSGSWTGDGRVCGIAGRVVFEFPDNGFNNHGDTTNWHHYALTFSDGLAVSYFDGTPWGTNRMGVTNLTVGWNNNVTVATAFIGIGCNTHGGTPALEDESGEDYPNHGWLNGAMDDVAIYSRALSASEIGVLSGYGAIEETAPPDVSAAPTYLRLRIR